MPERLRQFLLGLLGAAVILGLVYLIALGASTE